MGEDPYNRTRAITRLVVVYVVLGALVAFSRPTPAGVTLGFAVAAIGETLRFWAAGHLLKSRELVTSGPYRYTRNPLYLGRLLVFTGICIMAALPWGLNWIVMVAGWILFFAYYLRRKERVEPARLRALHGEAFERYFRAVPALFPSLRPWSEGGSGAWSSDRLLRNREHWMLVALLALSLFLLWRAYALEAARYSSPAGEDAAVSSAAAGAGGSGSSPGARRSPSPFANR